MHELTMIEMPVVGGGAM